MKRIAAILTVVALAGCAAQNHDHTALQENNGWCDRCGVGYAGGMEFKKKCCYEAGLNGKACDQCVKKGAPKQTNPDS